MSLVLAVQDSDRISAIHAIQDSHFLLSLIPSDSVCPATRNAKPVLGQQITNVSLALIQITELVAQTAVSAVIHHAKLVKPPMMLLSV